MTGKYCYVGIGDFIGQAYPLVGSLKLLARRSALASCVEAPQKPNFDGKVDGVENSIYLLILFWVLVQLLLQRCELLPNGQG